MIISRALVDKVNHVRPQLNAAKGLLAEMKSIGLVGTPEIYGRMVSICTGCQDYDGARLMVSEMESLGLRMDTICCTAIIKVQLREMVASLACNCPLQALITFEQLLLQAYGGAGWVDAAFETYQSMKYGIITVAYCSI